MFTNPSPRGRAAAMLSLLLHLLLVGVGPVADARLEAEAASRQHGPVHVEDAADPHCDNGHHHPFCLVRALQQMDAPPAGASVRGVRSFLPIRRPAASPLAPASASALPALGPRGPPAA